MQEKEKTRGIGILDIALLLVVAVIGIFFLWFMLAVLSLLIGNCLGTLEGILG